MGKNRNNAIKYFKGKGVWDKFEKPTMHHKDITLRHTDRKRYDEWNPEDLVVMEFSDHSKLHMDISGNCMNREDVKKKHREKMNSKEVTSKISASMKKYRNETKGTQKEIERNRKISEKLRGRNIGNQNKDTRSVNCFCIVDGEDHHFHNYLIAGKWWYENYHPFGESYSEATFQRKIKQSIDGNPIVYGKGKDKVEVNNIKWFREGVV